MNFITLQTFMPLDYYYYCYSLVIIISLNYMGLPQPETPSFIGRVKETLGKAYYGNAMYADFNKYDAITANVRLAIQTTENNRWNAGLRVLDQRPMTRADAVGFIEAYADFTLWENRWDQFMGVDKTRRMDKAVIAQALNVRGVLDTVSVDDLNDEQLGALRAFVPMLNKVTTPTRARNDEDAIVTRTSGMGQIGSESTEQKATWGQVKSLVLDSLK